MMRRVLICFALLVVLFLCLPALPPKLAHLVVQLPWGWINFLRRVLPEVSLNWSGIGMVVVCSAVAIGCLHWLCGWFHAHLRAGVGESGATVAPRWSRRWTFALYAGFWVLFCIVMGAAGLARQVNWLMESQEPLRVERVNHHAELRMAAMEMQNALMDGEGDLARTSAAFMSASNQGLSRRPTTWERHHALFFEDANDRLAAVVIFPRDPHIRPKVGFTVVDDNFGGEIQPMTNLPTVIASLEALRTNGIRTRQ